MATLCNALRTKIPSSIGFASKPLAPASFHTSSAAHKRLNFENDVTPTSKEFLLLDSDRSGSEVAFNWSLVFSEVPPCNNVEKNADASRLARIYRSKEGVLNATSGKDTFQLKHLAGNSYDAAQLKVAQYLSEEVPTLYVNDVAAGSEAPFLHLRVISDDPISSAFVSNTLQPRNPSLGADQIIGKPCFNFPKEISPEVLAKQGVDLSNKYENNSTIYFAAHKSNETGSVSVSGDGNRAIVAGTTSTAALRKAIGFSAIAGYLSKNILLTESEVVKGSKGNHVLVANAPESPKESPLGFNHHLWSATGLSRFWSGYTSAGKAEKPAANALLEAVGDSFRTTQPHASGAASAGHPSHFVLVADDKSSALPTLTKVTAEQAGKILAAGHIGNAKTPFRPFPVAGAEAYGKLLETLLSGSKATAYVVNLSAGKERLSVGQLKAIVDAVANGEADSAAASEIPVLGFHAITAVGKLPLSASSADAAAAEAYATALGLSKPKA